MNPERKKLINEISKKDYKKSAIKQIAEDNNLTKTELERIYLIEFFKEIANVIDFDTLTEININEIEKRIDLEQNNLEETKKKFQFIKSELKKILAKCLYIATKNGFPVNVNNHIKEGTMTANAGDSAEFIFVARAILAGFNCSSVDVRSSRYDAIIDYKNKLLRVQIKGISTGNNISFKDRDRGGQGIDYKHERNIGKRITSQDCDIYVAVDKQVGLCYIIPMDWADNLSENQCKSVKLDEISNFKENWDMIQQKAENLL